MSKKVADLARERRVRANLAELRELLHENPELASRTHDMLAGRTPCPDLEDRPMAAQRPLESVRLPGDMMERAEALVPLMEDDVELTAFGRVNKSSVIRLALHRGLAQLEEQYGAKPKGKKRGR